MDCKPNINYQLFLFFIFHLSLFTFSAKGQNSDTSLYFEQPYILQRADLNSITCIFKDSRHILWFGTANGLYSFDGTNLSYFGHKIGDTASLPSNKILNIAEDKEGQLWVAMLNGIAKIDLRTLQVKSFTAANKRMAEYNFTNRLCIDNDDNIWVGNNNGIYKFDKEKQVFKEVWNNRIPGDSISNYITSVIDNNNPENPGLIASAFHSVVFYNKNNHSFERLKLFGFHPPKDTAITTVFLDSHKKLWIGTWGGGIYSLSVSKERENPVPLVHSHTHISPEHVNFNNLPYFYVTSFYETKWGDLNYLWVSTSAGIIKCILDSDDHIKNYSFISYHNNKNDIIPYKIESLYLDNDGALWCAGDRGVCRCYPFRNNFKLFASLNGLILDIQTLQINSIANSFFINSWNSPPSPEQGFLLTDTLGKSVFKNIDPKFTDIDDRKNISGVIHDKYNRLWFASMGGISVLNTPFAPYRGLGAVVKQWDKNTTGENKLTYYRTSGIALHNDTVWVVCYHHGVDLFDLSFKKIGHYSRKDGSGMQDFIISSLFNDSKGSLWICGDEKLYKYLPSTHTFKSYKFSPEPSGDFRPKEIVETKNGEFIIPSFCGLIQFNPVTEKYFYIYSDILQKEQNINSAAIDKRGDVWFLTDKHLVHYKPAEKRFILFGKEDGLDVDKGLNEIRTFNGTDFYICQEQQVVKFNCDSMNQPGMPPNLLLNVQVNDSLIYGNDTNIVLQLPYNKNRLMFEFTGVSYIKADQNQYYYQLSDADKQWNTTYRNTVSYAGLPPGKYSFKVKTVNYAGMWSNLKTISFVVNPPYWRTWWFMFIAAFAVFLALFIIIRYISQRNLKEKILQLEKETAVEKERSRIARDMHDDLGSGLTKITILSQVAGARISEPDAVREQLKRIADSSNMLVENLQDIIWMLNTRHDRLDSLSIYISDYATRFFESSNITVSFVYPAPLESVPISQEKRRNLFLCMKETFHNIIKHSGASLVLVKLTLSPDKITFAVTDNGQGFDTYHTRMFSNGLKNMEERMKSVNGECGISSSPGKGTSLTFTIPI